MTIGCPECGALEEVPPLGRHANAFCRLCQSPLERRNGRSVVAALAFASATFVLLFPANFLPLMTVYLLGADRSSVLASGIVQMWREGELILPLLLGAFGIVLPFVRFGALTLVLGAIVCSRPFPGIGRLFRWTVLLDVWTMPDVFLVGCFVGYARVTQDLTGTIGAGGYCFIAAALGSMLARATLDRRTVWRAIRGERRLETAAGMVSCHVCDSVEPMDREGHPCPRCGSTLRARKRDAIVRASALTLAALVLVAPANIYPMTLSYQFGHAVPHRIIDGVLDLFEAGLWPLGILVTCTSIVIPVAKLAGMGWFIASVKLRSRRRLREKTHLYRWIDELGRWSYVDVFTIVAFTPLIRFDGISTARDGPGAIAFALVVFLTMAASRAFDPRMMWDAPGGNTDE